jgi:hypothetical protein
MAVILGRTTNFNQQILSVDADPTTGGGTASPVGTVAIVFGTGVLFRKFGAGATDWTPVGFDVFNPDRVVVFNSDVFATLQDCVDFAEALPGALDGQGIAVLIPLSDTNGDTATIRRNLRLQGIGAFEPSDPLITLTYRPTSAVDAPDFGAVENLFCDIQLFNETSGGGVFNPNMFPSDFLVKNSQINNLVADRIFGEVVVENCEGAGGSFDLSNSLRILNSTEIALTFSIDDTETNLPTGYAGISIETTNSEVNFDITQVAGASDANIVAQDTHFDSLILNNGAPVLQIEGGAIRNYAVVGAVPVYVEFQAFAPYEPVDPTDWDPDPQFVHDALDQLAARTSGPVESGQVSITVPALLAGANADVNATITGLADGDIVTLMPDNAAMEADLAIVAVWVSAADTITVRLANIGALTLTGSTTNWDYLWTDLTP